MCRQALKPRLLIIVGLTAALAFYNSAAEHKIGLVEESALFAGFLSYKVVILSDSAHVLCCRVICLLWSRLTQTVQARLQETL